MRGFKCKFLEPHCLNTELTTAGHRWPLAHGDICNKFDAHEIHKSNQ